MKYLNHQSEFNQIEELITQYLENVRVLNLDYTINNDLTVDIDGDIYLAYGNLQEIPISFGTINGYFNCSYNHLTSLKNCPKVINGMFDCSNNQIKSLEYGPTYVGGSEYDCSKNQISKLEGLQDIINGSFYCNSNKLVTLEGCPSTINVSFDCSENKLKTLKGGPKYVEEMFYYGDNFDLPKELFRHCGRRDDDGSIIKGILKYQDDYNIWNPDNTLNLQRFEMMLEEENIK